MKKKLILWYPALYNAKMVRGKIGLQEPLALATIAAMTPDDWDVCIRDAHHDEVKYEECDLVGISAMTAQALRAYEIANMFREKGVKVVMGGMHATVCAEEALRYVDVVVKGEAELLWGRLLEDFKKGRLKKVYETDETHDLKNLPRPRRDLFVGDYYWSSAQTTRGCPFDCEFCAVTAFNGGKYRKRPVNEVLDELEEVKGKFLFFADDNMHGFSKSDHERFIELCEGMVKRKIKKYWIAQVSINFAKDDRVMKAARKAGCGFVIIGIESASPDVLGGNMNKKINLNYINDLKDHLKRIHKNGIATISYFILGNDEEDKGCFQKTYEFAKKLDIIGAAAVPLIPRPGTKLWDRLSSENRLKQTNFPQDWAMPDLCKFKLKTMSELELAEGLVWLNKKLLFPPRAVWRSLKAAYYNGSIQTFFTMLDFYFSARQKLFRAAKEARKLKKEMSKRRLASS